MKNLIIIGAGGFGRETAWLVDRINAVSPQWNLLGFADDNANALPESVDGYKILGGCDAIKNYPDAFAVCCIANTRIRKMIIDKVSALGNKFATLIDPAAICSGKVAIGEGTVICAGAVLTVDIKIGRHCIIDVNSTVGHDAVLKDFVTLYPSVNVSGNTLLKEGVQAGTGSQILQGLTVGEGTFVGAGAVVIKDLPGGCTAVGVPARAVKKYEG